MTTAEKLIVDAIPTQVMQMHVGGKRTILIQLEDEERPDIKWGDKVKVVIIKE